MTAAQEKVKAIHSAVNEATDVLLQDAPYDFKELQTLRDLGFINSENAKDIEDFGNNSSYARKYNQVYPQYKFITDHQLDKIKKKYNLIEGNLSSFKGNIPAKNIADMLNCKIKAGDIKEPADTLSSASDAWLNMYTDLIFGNTIRERTAGRTAGKSIKQRIDDEVRRSPGVHPVNPGPDYYQRTPWLQQIEKNPFAHRPDQMLRFKDIVENYPQAVTITADRELFNIPDRDLDPIVTVAVKGGYLIVTAWGAEGSDPDVVNQVMN